MASFHISTPLILFMLFAFSLPLCSSFPSSLGSSIALTSPPFPFRRLDLSLSFRLAFPPSLPPSASQTVCVCLLCLSALLSLRWIRILSVCSFNRRTRFVRSSICFVCSHLSSLVQSLVRVSHARCLAPPPRPLRSLALSNSSLLCLSPPVGFFLLFSWILMRAAFSFEQLLLFPPIPHLSCLTALIHHPDRMDLFLVPSPRTLLLCCLAAARELSFSAACNCALRSIRILSFTTRFPPFPAFSRPLAWNPSHHTLITVGSSMRSRTLQADLDESARTE